MIQEILFPTIVYDLAILAYTQAQIRDKIDKVWQAARHVGLEINVPKTKFLCLNTR